MKKIYLIEVPDNIPEDGKQPMKLYADFDTWIGKVKFTEITLPTEEDMIEYINSLGEHHIVCITDVYKWLINKIKSQ